MEFEGGSEGELLSSGAGWVVDGCFCEFLVSVR